MGASVNAHDLPTRVLLVAPSARVASELAAALRAAGCAPIVVSDFVAAKAVLDTQPDLLITEVKLGAYNGLHLAIRAAGQHTPTIVIGDMDPVLKVEAERQNAAFLRTPVEPERVLLLMRELLPASPWNTRRSLRKRVGALDAFVNDIQAHLLDVSYEGMRIEATDSQPATLPGHFTIRLPLFNFSCPVQRVWTALSSVEGSSVSCGAELSTSDADTVLAWRTLVDSLPDLALTGLGNDR